MVATPLDGVSVLELGHIAAGPTAGMMLAGLGADVTKIEPPGGEQARKPSVPGTFVYLNRGKGSLELDLKSPTDHSRFLDLAAGVDVVITNYAPGVVERLGVSYADLSRLNPRLVYGAITGYPEGPAEQLPALDEVIQMHTGLAFLTGPGDRPLRAGASVLDMTAGMFVALGVTAALRERELTGRGALVSSSLLEVGAYYVGQAMAAYQISGQPSIPFPERDGAGARMFGWGIYDIFLTSEGNKVFLGITSDGHWTRFCAHFGLTEMAADPAYASNRDRLASRSVLVPRIAELVSTLTVDEFVRSCEQERIPHAVVGPPERLLNDPALAAMLRPTQFESATVQLPAFPVAWWSPEDGSFQRSELGDPPALDQSNLLSSPTRSRS